MGGKMVKSHDVHVDSDYIKWVAELKQRYRSAQVKAAIRVNAEKLQFNWLLGRDLVRKKAEERWGTGVVEQLSLDLQREFPDADGLSARNMWYMKKWYCFYTRNGVDQILQQVVAEFGNEKLHQVGAELERSNFNQSSGRMPTIFAGIPWRHHVEIITKNVTDLLLEMGTGFAFVGRQKEVIVSGRSRKIDLLFYHIRLRCFVVCELKAKPFEPEYVGKLNFYVNAVDELLKAPEDNPTIGLLICSNIDFTDVQWSFRGLGTPMGVATYNNIRIKDALPSKELLEERMRLLQKEVHSTKRLIQKKVKKE